MTLLKSTLFATGAAAMMLGTLARVARTQVYIPVPVYYHHAAIAYSVSTNLSTSSHRAATQENANLSALNTCMEAGITDCEVVLTFVNKCGALASSHNGAWAAKSHRSVNEAIRVALEKCNEFGGKDCKLKQALCAITGEADVF